MIRGARVILSRLRLLNFRYLRQHPARTALSLGVLTVSAALIVSVLGIYGSVSGSVGRLTGQVAGEAELEVTGRTDGGLSAAQAKRADEVDGVETAVPLVRAPVRVDGERVLLFGADSRASALRSDLSEMTAEPSGNGGDSALFAGPNLDVPGDKPLGIQSMAGQTQRMPLAGVLKGSAAGQVNDGQYLVAPLPVAQRLAGLGDRVESVLVVTEKGADAGAVRDRLAKELGPRAFVSDTSFRTEQADKATALVRNVTLLVAFMALVVAGFLIFNSMNMSAAERRAEMASLRALGSRRRPIMRDFLLESLVLALAGAALGSGLGYLIAGASVDSLPPVITDAVDARITTAVPPSAVPAAVLACVGAGLAASWLAARRVSRVSPVEAMRTADPAADTGEGERHPGRTLTLLLGVIALVMALGTALAFDDERSFGSGALFLVGVILLSYALIPEVTRLTAWVAARLGGPGRIAATAVARAPRRAWATGMTVCLAVAIGAATTGASQNTVDAASENVSTLADSDFVVQRASADVLPVRPLMPASDGERLAEVKGVERVVAGQFTYLNLDDERALLQGVGGPSNSTAYRLADGPARKALRDGSGAVVSRAFAKDNGLERGDRLTLPTPKGEQRIRIADVVDYVSMDAGLVALSMDRLAEWYGQSGASFYEVLLEPGADAGAVQERLEAAAEARPYPVNVLTGDEAVDAMETAVRQIQSLALALQWVIAGVAALALLNTLMLAVVERRRELGILRALGGSGRYVRRVILAEAAAVSLVGGVAGVLVGSVLHALSTRVMATSVAMEIPFEVAPAALALAVGAIVIAMAGSVPPARRAGKLNVVRAIGYE
ncbi:FtsX-like permease family protein [Streptomyces sp. AJS327]|uniref:ABC transporter permease n=1 Tax=Streptomyces sp. AJS327 TaxID=2545265 RepID=UPI0015DE4FAA|nr:FtsX-like permease family protein [Streptomyces sp. AJS327]MBA0049535.1 FtsX-like permease family protein [Streptomyces sp. AJS327]QTC09990.1 FtsX-like permease family protein [Streptomyces sp.]